MAKIKIPTVNEKLLERYIRHSVYLEQLKIGEAKLVSRFLKQKVFPQIYGDLVGVLSKVKNLETIGSIYKVKRLKKMLAAVQKISAAGVAKVEKKLVNRLVNVSRFEAKWDANMISKTVPVDIDMTMPSNEVLKNLVTMRPMSGHKLGTWMSGYSTAIRVAMTKQIKMGIASGESLSKIGQRINKALNWKGKQAQYIARTAVSNVVHQAKEEVFKKNRDIIRKVQWISTLDVRTSIECIHLDGKMFNVADGPRPPIHFNCRSTVIPITPSWQEFGIEDPPPATRASMDGGVPAKMNYRTWLKKQSKATQIKVLGKKRANLYRTGRVKIDRFVGRDLKPLTLKQLARREGIDIDLPVPPMKVKAMSVKGTGIKLIDFDKSILRKYSEGDFKNIVPVQLGGKFSAKLSSLTKQKMLKNAKNLENTISKLKGWEGTSYRGMTFSNKAEKIKFLSKLKEGGVWKSECFLATSKSQSIAIEYAELKAQNITMVVKGRSGRDITRYWGASMKEVLFKKGTSFKIDKVIGNKVYLSEVTKQVQLKVLPTPPATATRVGTTFVKGTSKEFNKIVDDAVDAYPEKVKLALNDRGITYKAGNRITEIHPELKGVHPIGYPAKSTFDSVPGVYKTREKAISIGENFVPIGRKEFLKTPKETIRGILNHETGHGFDASPEGLFYSSRPEFKTAYAKDIKNVSKLSKSMNNLNYYFQKGIRGRSETFAELFADIMGQGSAPAGRDIRKFFPNSTKLVESVLK